MHHTWATDAIFYHIYPLGLCGAPPRNDFCQAPVERLAELYGWLDHIQGLGATALYLGPLFESSAHGYDTADYYQVDRRLGERKTLADFSRELHRRGMRLVLDGVFNHVGRDFWAFRDLQQYGAASAYRDWFYGLDFNRRSPYGDAFAYEGWSGHYDLVKLNLSNPAVRAHLFDAVGMWVEEFAIDGLRLDAADQIAPDFLAALAQHCRGLRHDFWLMGEIVFGDYRRLAQPGLLDSTTNYECYKGLYSSHVDRNYFELAYSLNRLFGAQGLYRELDLYAFADNHDVNRVASSLSDPAHLYPLYCLLFTMPGIPSVYYGSEWGLGGQRTAQGDAELRPRLTVQPGEHDLVRAIGRLARLHRQYAALRCGEYEQVHVAHEQFAFLRSLPGERLLVAVNAAATAASITVRLPVERGTLVDALNPGARFAIEGGQARVDLTPAWGRVMVVEGG